MSDTDRPIEIDRTADGCTCFLAGDEPVTPLDTVTFIEDAAPGSLSFHLADRELLRFDADGAVYVRGEKVDDNLAIYEAVKAFFLRRPL